MKTERIQLNGSWQLKGIGPKEENIIDIPAIVPGHAHHDLEEADLIPDPFWRDQSSQSQWVETWDWHYARQFDIPENFHPGWAVLEFEGIDTFSTIILNGREIGHTSNMFIPYRFEVGNLLQAGRNTLEVQILAHGKFFANKPLDKYVCLFAEDRLYKRKMQCGFGWDHIPRLVSAGIWQPVNLYFHDGARIEDAFVYTENLDENSASLKLEITTERRTDKALWLQLQILDPQGTVAWSQKFDLNDPMLKTAIAIQNPQLWWPNDFGEHPLYTLQASILDGSNAELDWHSVEFGIRTVQIEEIPDEAGSSFTLIVNGERIFCKGGNWVPANPFPSRIPPEKYQRLIGLARDAHMNLLRVWGGGIYEPDAFWRACNRAGVMIIQDFMMSCATYPQDDPDFMIQIKEEAPLVIRRLRNHPSLAVWSGDNECGMNDPADAEYLGKKIAREITGRACAEMDPARPFRMTCPFGGSPNNGRLIGDCHASAWYDEEFHYSEMSDYRQRIDALAGRFLSESAICGTPPEWSMLKFMTREDLKDPLARIWEHHTNDNPYKGFLSNMSHYQMTQNCGRKLFGDSEDISAKLARMGYMQYEWVRLETESLRRQKFYCSGVLYWMYNDNWPASDWSVVDYYGYAKAGYYGARRTNAPVIASLEEKEQEIRVWVLNDRRTPVSGEISVRVQPWQGQPLWRRQLNFEVPANTSQTVLSIPKRELEGKLTLQSLLVCDLKTPKETDRAFLYLGVPKQMDLPPARLSVKREGDDKSGTLTIHTDNFARVVTLAGDLDFTDNYFDLLPGETKVIRYRSPADAHQGVIPVSCWNGAK